jgi:pyridoxine 5'-phosphate synthase PdxJ
MAYTQDDIDALKAAIATGATEVTFGSGPDRRTVIYRDLPAMRSILADMVAEVSPAALPPRVSYIRHTRD